MSTRPAVKLSLPRRLPVPQPHVAMHVGGGMIIDAPRTGLTVEKISLSTSWYASTVDSARP